MSFTVLRFKTSWLRLLVGPLTVSEPWLKWPSGSVPLEFIWISKNESLVRVPAAYDNVYQACYASASDWLFFFFPNIFYVCLIKWLFPFTYSDHGSDPKYPPCFNQEAFKQKALKLPFISFMALNQNALKLLFISFIYDSLCRFFIIG